ncbi:MAG: hypothetical protein KAH54_02010 [Candidatus Sabulitectum sp.]|nr:hypothetical protein [Candidatus Sabulitectum sp.]
MDKLIALSLLLCFGSCAVFVPAATDETDTGQLVFHHSAAGRVQLVGDWNNWGGATDATGMVDPSSGVMENDNGIWTASPPDDLDKGRYRYAFLVNGSQFIPDPANPERTIFMEHEVSVLLID